jgi:hypothetical protein
MANRNESSGLVTLVCITCGREQFHSHDVPQSTVCDKCGGTVFRAFATPTKPDDATIAALEEQTRSLSYGDPSPDSTRGDVGDLDLGPR